MKQTVTIGRDVATPESVAEGDAVLQNQELSPGEEPRAGSVLTTSQAGAASKNDKVVDGDPTSAEF